MARVSAGEVRAGHFFLVWCWFLSCLLLAWEIHVIPLIGDKESFPHLLLSAETPKQIPVSFLSALESRRGAASL